MQLNTSKGNQSHDTKTKTHDTSCNTSILSLFTMSINATQYMCLFNISYLRCMIHGYSCAFVSFYNVNKRNTVHVTEAFFLELYEQRSQCCYIFKLFFSELIHTQQDQLRLSRRLGGRGRTVDRPLTERARVRSGVAVSQQ